MPYSQAAAPLPNTSAAAASGAGGRADRIDLADSLGDFLVERGVIDSAVLDRSRRAARTTGERFDRVLTKLGLLSEADLTAALCAFLSIAPAFLADVLPEPVLPDVIKPDFVRSNRIMPLALAEDALVVGVTDPFNDEPLRALAFLVDLTVSVRLFVPADFDKAYEAVYAPAGEEAGDARGSGSEASDIDVARLRDMASEAPTIRLVNQIVNEAVETDASDIHLEPTADAVLVRYRIDGALRTVRTLPSEVRAAVTSRIKIMARLDIAERRLPQDGRIKIAIRGVDIDFRVSAIPTVFGESVVLRILDRTRVELDFVKLGFGPEHVAELERLMSEPNGIILVTGPTGSGKTTTLYTALKMLNVPNRKLFTVEDPIEYQLDRINQVQVHSAIGFDFPHALRSILRQDPDIIMIGEIRDLETARIAVQSSLVSDRRRLVASLRVAREEYSRDSIDAFLKSHRLKRRDVPLGLGLPPGSVFCRSFALPLETRRSLDAIVVQDLVAKTPFQLDGIHHAHVARRAGDKFLVWQWVARRKHVEEAAEALDLEPGEVAFIESSGARTDEGPLPVIRLGQVTRDRSRWVQWTALTLTATALVLAVVALGAKVQSQQLLLDRLDAQITAARTKAKAVRAAIERLDQEEARLQRLRSRRSEPGLLDLWEEATRILPAHTWLSELRLSETPEGRQVVMTGFSAAAASLVSLIERSPLFGEASLAGPVSVDQAEGKERFVIQAKVAGAAKPTAASR